MPTKRMKQVSVLLQKELSQILQTKIKDPDIGFVTITHVTLSPDLRNAKVYVSMMGDETQIGTCMQALEKARSFIQSELAGRIRLRFVPVLKFFFDDTLAYQSKIDTMIDNLHLDSDSTTNET